jgi:hypothetical protein
MFSVNYRNIIKIVRAASEEICFFFGGGPIWRVPIFVMSAVLPLLLSAGYKMSINLTIQSTTRLISHEHTPTRYNMNKFHLTVRALSRRTYIHTNIQAKGISELAYSYSSGEGRKRVIPSKSLYSHLLVYYMFRL